MKRDGSGKDGAAREDRLKAALKANLARRKAQARARATPEDGDTQAGHDPAQTGRDEGNG